MLASSDLCLLHKTKTNLIEKFEMKYMGKASYVIGIEIFRDRSLGILGLSQKAYVDKVLNRYGKMTCFSNVVPIQIWDKLSFDQCPQNDLKHKEIEKYPYASLVGSLLHAQVYTRPNNSHNVRMLGIFQSNPRMAHWLVAKKVLRYLNGTKYYMLTNIKSNHVEVIGYLDLDFGGCLDSRHCTLSFVFLLTGSAISWKICKSELL